MEFKKDEIDLVFSYWMDVSQDPDFISTDTDISIDKVHDILNLLSEQGKIDDYSINENRIFLFEELLDIDDYFALDLDKFSTSGDDLEYFFDFVEINKRFNKDPFTILVKSKSFHQDYIILSMDVIYLDKTYSISLLLDRTDSVYFISEDRSSSLEDFFDVLGDDKQRFFKFSEEVLDRLVPYDFWETKSKFN